MNVAKAIDATPVVSSATERAALFPIPDMDQRVFNKGNRNTERWDGTQWVTDSARVFTPQMFAAFSDGVTDDSAFLTNANTAATGAAGGAGASIVISAPHRVSANISFASNVTLIFQGGGSFVIDSGKTVTCNGQVIALSGSPHSGLGTMTFANQSNLFMNGFGLGFGNVEPSNTDDLVHIQRDINTASGINIKNLFAGVTAEAYIHMWGGALNQGSDLQLRSQAKEMGGNVNIVAGHGTSIGTFNLIQSDNKTLNFYANNTKVVEITPSASTVNYIAFKGSATGSGTNITTAGIDANITLSINSAGTGSITLRTNAGAASQVLILHTATPTRQITLTGSNGGNPTIDVNGGALRLSAGTSDIQWGKALVALGGGAAPTLGTIGGTGPATAAQNSWVRMLDSTGAAIWLPAWK